MSLAQKPWDTQLKLFSEKPHVMCPRRLPLVSFGYWPLLAGRSSFAGPHLLVLIYQFSFAGPHLWVLICKWCPSVTGLSQNGKMAMTTKVVVLQWLWAAQLWIYNLHFANITTNDKFHYTSVPVDLISVPKICIKLFSTPREMPPDKTDGGRFPVIWKFEQIWDGRVWFGIDKRRWEQSIRGNGL